MIRKALPFALAGVGGAMMFFATATWDVWPLGWVCLLPFLLAVRVQGAGARPRRVLLAAWFGGTIANAGGFYWVLDLLVRFGHLPLVGAFPLFLLLVGYQGLLFALWAVIVHRLVVRRGLPATLVAPVALVPLELVYPMVFPWYLAINQAWVPETIQIAELTGPTGVSALLALASGALYDVVDARLAGRRLPVRAAGAAAAIVAAAIGGGIVRIGQIEARRAAAPHVKVGLVQANVAQLEKFDPRFSDEQLRLHHDASRELARQGAELIVWPESSYPHLLHRDTKNDYPQGDPARIRNGWTVPTLIGAPTAIAQGNDVAAWNTAIMIDRNGRFTGRFDKVYLMIFGEYIPFYDWLPSFREWFPEASNWERGKDITTFPFERVDPRTGKPQAFKLGPIICYEDIIPAFVRKVMALAPHLLVNITNDAWFGKTSEPYEHLQLAVFRSIEHRRDMVRAVNTGVSTFVSATGRVYRKSIVVDPVTEKVPPVTLLDEVAMLEGRTVYGVIGDLFAYLCAIGLLVLLWRSRTPRAQVTDLPA